MILGFAVAVISNHLYCQNKTPHSNTTTSTPGRNDFQTRYISWSYRRRGSVARGTSNITAIAVPRNNTPLPTHNHILKAPRSIGAAYSPKKIKTNIIPLYSVLNPDTSSLSPSTKSKGVRILSAKQQTRKQHNTPRVHTATPLCRIEYPTSTMDNRNKKLYTISYETVWATARRPPTTLYFDPLPHPAPNLPKTWALNRAKISTTTYLDPACLHARGHQTQRRTGTVRIAPPASQYREEAVLTWVLCLRSSLIASANGTKRPTRLGFAAPLRIWA